jgi:hypothetical protein
MTSPLLFQHDLSGEQQKSSAASVKERTIESTVFKAKIPTIIV